MGSLGIHAAKRQFVLLMKQLDPATMPQFAIWLDYKVSEYKILGRLKYDEEYTKKKNALKYPDWITRALRQNLTFLFNDDDDNKSEQEAGPSRENAGSSAPMCTEFNLERTEATSYNPSRTEATDKMINPNRTERVNEELNSQNSEDVRVKQDLRRINPHRTGRVDVMDLTRVKEEVDDDEVVMESFSGADLSDSSFKTSSTGSSSKNANLSVFPPQRYADDTYADSVTGGDSVYEAGTTVALAGDSNVLEPRAVVRNTDADITSGGEPAVTNVLAHAAPTNPTLLPATLNPTLLPSTSASCTFALEKCVRSINEKREKSMKSERHDVIDNRTSDVIDNRTSDVTERLSDAGESILCPYCRLSIASANLAVHMTTCHGFEQSYNSLVMKRNSLPADDYLTGFRITNFNQSASGSQSLSEAPVELDEKPFSCKSRHERYRKFREKMKADPERLKRYREMNKIHQRMCRLRRKMKQQSQLPAGEMKPSEGMDGLIEQMKRAEEEEQRLLQQGDTNSETQ